MKFSIKAMFSNKKVRTQSPLTKRVNKSVIDSAYNKRRTELESLRDYDRGIKNIDAPNIGSIVRRLRKSS